MMHTTLLAVAGTALLAIASPAVAATFSFSGSFAADDDVRRFDFTVGAPSTVTLRSYSYAGGTQADGTVVSAGGFDPILALFDGATGALIDQQDDADDDGRVPPDPETGEVYDVLLEIALEAGSYFVTVMQFDNFANGPFISDGFERGGDGNFTDADFGCDGGRFCDGQDVSRTGAWAFDILDVDDAVLVDPDVPAVPLPASGLLLAGAVAAMAGARRRALR